MATSRGGSQNEEKLTNFLMKLPKAHRWTVYEFFYSDIDYALLEGESEFKICLRYDFFVSLDFVTAVLN